MIGNGYRHAHEFVRHNVPEQKGRAALAEGITESLRKNKHCVLTTIPGRDEFYLLPNTIKIEQDIEINADENMNASQLSKQLTKVLTSKKTSRIVLSKFIDQVS